MSPEESAKETRRIGRELFKRNGSAILTNVCKFYAGCAAIFAVGYYGAKGLIWLAGKMQ